MSTDAGSIRFDEALHMWVRILGDQVEPLTASAAAALLADPVLARRSAVAEARAILAAVPTATTGRVLALVARRGS